MLSNLGNNDLYKEIPKFPASSQRMTLSVFLSLFSSLSPYFLSLPPLFSSLLNFSFSKLQEISSEARKKGKSPDLEKESSDSQWGNSKEVQTEGRAGLIPQGSGPCTRLLQAPSLISTRGVLENQMFRFSEQTSYCAHRQLEFFKAAQFLLF